VDSDELIAAIISIVNVDLHKRVAGTIAKGRSTSHNMRESIWMVIKTLLCGSLS
jgi:hypothetical protein